MPLAVGMVLDDPTRTWSFRTTPQKSLDCRSVEQPRGKVMGGTSSVNGMVWSRGHPLDFDLWASDYGAEGWSAAEVLPYFKRVEAHQNGGDNYRGKDGPIPITSPDLRKDPLATAFIEAGFNAGYPVTPDSNGYQQEGFGPNENNIFSGRRFSSAKAYIDPAIGRGNLRIEKNCLVTRIVVTDGRASAVEYLQNGTLKTAECDGEIILSAGAFGSPKILMQSGIGDLGELSSLGIAPVHHLPGVGRNLHDHAEIHIQHACAPNQSLARDSQFPRKILHGIRWFARHRGCCATNHLHAAAFLRSAAGIRWPDLKLEIFPIAYDDDLAPLADAAFQVHIGLMRPKSRGTLRLASTDPRAEPLIDPNLLDDEEDLRAMVNGMTLLRELMRQDPLADLAGPEKMPGAQLRSEDDIAEWIRRTARGAYHPVGSCRIGRRDDPMSVVDSTLKVKGLRGLRVVDASVMPAVTNGNTNAPAIMLAEKAADMILERPPLAAEALPYWEHPDWQNKQR